MSDNEIEDVSFLPGQMPTGKRCVYEPKGPSQRCKQLVCSKNRAILIVAVVAIFILVIALIASLARPSSGSSSSQVLSEDVCTTTVAAGDSDTGDADHLATNGERFPWSGIRLPPNVLPITYDLFIHPNLTTFHFKGHVKISVRIAEPTDFVVLHIKHLNYSAVRLTDKASGQTVKITKVLEYIKYEQLYIKTEQQMHQGAEYELSIQFSANLSDALVGFYKSAYTTSGGEARWLATTHFEPTDARAAFPCFDEPQLKASFALQMVRDANHTALFNTPHVQTDPLPENQELLVDTFEASVKMSTYLVAFVVCDYAHISKTTANGIKVSVYTPPELIDQAQFALDAATSIIEYYEEFFGVRYPLKKQDLIAIPDFAAGAMENWGLITYRMVALLYDPQESSTSNQQWVAIVVAHELAHQWFGNLVTMNWWNDLWLNEGFASFVEYLGTAYFKPEWKMLDQFVGETLVAALHSDSLRSSHPISVDVNDPAEINEIFDQISYEKGSSIIRMLEGFLGREQLQVGLKHYLKKYQFSNAITDDLWAAMSDTAADTGLNVDVKAVMDTWTLQMGYPLVTVTVVNNKVTASQERFLLNPRGKQKDEFTSPFGYKWNIPLTYITSQSAGSQQPMHWMEKDSVSFMLTETPAWVKMNVNFTGFYRVHYDLDNWKALIQQLITDHIVLSPADRANLLDDAFSLSSSGHLNIDIVLHMTTYLINESDYVPWSVALDNLQYIGNLLANKPTFQLFADYVQKLMANQLALWKWEDIGSHLEKYLRTTILSTAVKLGHKASVAQARKLYSDWMKGETISANLKGVVYLGGVKYGGIDEWNYAWQQYKTTNIPSEKRKLMYALSTTTDANIINRYLSLSLDPKEIRKGDTVMVISNVANNPAGTVLAWRFVKQHWTRFKERYGDGSFDMTRLVLTTTSKFSTQYDYNEVKEFFEQHDSGSGRRAVSQTLESIERNIDWLAQNQDTAINWLTEYNKPDETT